MSKNFSFSTKLSIVLRVARRELKRHRSNSSTRTRNILVISSTISILCTIHTFVANKCQQLDYVVHAVVNSELETMARLSCAWLGLRNGFTRVEVMISISVVGWTAALCIRRNIHVRLADLASTVTWVTYVKPSRRKHVYKLPFSCEEHEGNDITAGRRFPNAIYLILECFATVYSFILKKYFLGVRGFFEESNFLEF